MLFFIFYIFHRVNDVVEVEVTAVAGVAAEVGAKAEVEVEADLHILMKQKKPEAVKKRSVAMKNQPMGKI